MILNPSKASFLAALLLTGFSLSPIAQADSPDRFVGTLTFEVSDGKLTTPVRYYSDGERLRVEMGSKEMPSRIWLSGVDEVEGVLALSPFKKTYTIEQDEIVLPYGMTREGRTKSPEDRKPVILPDPKTADVKGLDCVRFKLDTDGPAAEVWVLPNSVPIPLTVFGIWPDFLEAAPSIAKAIRSQNGLPLKIELRNWRGKALFALELTSVDASPPDPARFAMPDGYSRGGAAARLRNRQRDGIGN
jgi:hypothetical protein